jgi:hypothetical protein
MTIIGAMLRGAIVVTVAAHVVAMGSATRGERKDKTDWYLRRMQQNMQMNKASRIPYREDLGPGGEYPDVIGVLPLADMEQQAPVDPSIYSPGDFRGNLRSDDDSLRLCNGLQARAIASKGERVTYTNGEQSKTPFHLQPNGGAVFPKGHGGWTYLTNSGSTSAIGAEDESGGVGALEFDLEGSLIGYERLLSATTNSRGGGKTPWETWITCAFRGCRQVDPTGEREPEQTRLGILPNLGAFAFDESVSPPQFFVAQSEGDGVLTRFVPDEVGLACYKSEDKWCALESGQHDFLVLYTDRTFKWATDYDAAKESAFLYFRDADAITVEDGKLYIVTKILNQVVCLDLFSMTYAITSRAAELQQLVGSSTFYFPEGPNIFGRDEDEQFFILLYTDTLGADETIGVVMSPDQSHLYVSYQESGLIFDVQRVDGEPFQGQFVDINYLTLV